MTGSNELNDTESGVAFHVTARGASLILLVIIAAAVGSSFLASDHAAGAALKVVTATLAVGIVPGALLTLLWRPRPQLSALELVGFGIAVSFGVVHLLTMVAVSAHLSPVVILTILAVASALMAAWVFQRGSGAVVLSMDELIVLTLLCMLSVPLYLQGSPFEVYEDQVLAAIVRRLSVLDVPQLNNLYVTPGVVYTYPFPGALYFMALIARLGDIDPLFLYHKLRFFWGPVALVMLFLVARAVFEHAAVACAVTVTAVVLVCSGVFAMVAGFPAWWGQLVPYTYLPDVAMTVLLPALLGVAFAYLQSGPARERAFFFTATAMLVLMLTAVHIREIVQFAAYAGCFVVVAATFREFRPYFPRAMALLALTLVVAGAYTGWQSVTVPAVGDIVVRQRTELATTAANIPLWALVAAPASTVLDTFVQDFDQMFAGLTPFFLLAGPAVILLFRRQPLVWLLSSSTLAYLAVMSVPLLAIPYVYVTYFEILHIPVRNVMLFVYLFAGAIIYAAVVALTRIDRTRLSPLIAGATGGALALLTVLCLNRSHEGLFLPLIAAYGLTFLLVWGDPFTRRVTRRSMTALIVGLAALIAMWPDQVPVPRSEQVTIRWTSGLPDARRQALEQRFSLGGGEATPERTDEANVWNYRLRDLSVENVRTIVTEPDVVDTHFIDRSTFVVESQPPPGDDPPFGVRYVEWLRYPGMPLFVVTAAGAWVLGLLVPGLLASTRGDRAAVALQVAMKEPFYRRVLPYAMFVIPFALWSARPGLSPLTMAPMPPAGRADTARAMMTQIPCVITPRMQARFTEHLPGDPVLLPERTACPPDYAVIEWVRANVPVDAVFAIDRWNPYPLSVFAPQQTVVFPTLDASFLNEDDLFSAYYQLFDERMRRYRVQPFFNAVETPVERAAFVTALGVTHVLVSPAHLAELRPVLDGLPEQFALRYDQAGWAVYEATGNPD